MSKQACLHGGDIQTAKAQYQLDDLLDLSTGVNPQAYPVKGLSAEAFTQLPYLQQSFTQAASQYYQHSQMVVLPGSQQAIKALPTLLNQWPVLLPSHGYQEHQQAWQYKQQQHYPAFDLDKAASFISQAIEQQPQQHLLIINPNNPTGLLFSSEQIIEWANQLDPRAYVIVDEAFIDAYPQQSLLDCNKLPHNVVVLRSFGKFFGLAGLRLGFLFANLTICKQVEKQQDLWAINGPAQAMATLAFNDQDWIQQSQQQITLNAQFTRALFARQPLFVPHAHADSCSVFMTVRSLPVTVLPALLLIEFINNCCKKGC